ncbi:MAG: hypothetical protein H0V43_07375 [Gemmatimonadales bacterium]|nr:hypothetical protein [Gemmatimonadales bacterium]
MSHVFHPGHHALHGITVVLETHGAETFLGRFDSEDERGVHLLDVGVHELGAGLSKEEYIRRSAKFGIGVDRKHLLVPRDAVARITPLGELGG